MPRVANQILPETPVVLIQDLLLQSVKYITFATYKYRVWDQSSFGQSEHCQHQVSSILSYTIYKSEPNCNSIQPRSEYACPPRCPDSYAGKIYQRVEELECRGMDVYFLRRLHSSHSPLSAWRSHQNTDTSRPHSSSSYRHSQFIRGKRDDCHRKPGCTLIGP